MPKGSGSRQCGEKENRTCREGARQANVTHKASQSRSGWRPGGRLFGSWNNIYFEFCVRIVCQIPIDAQIRKNDRSDLRPISRSVSIELIPVIAFPARRCA